MGEAMNNTGWLGPDAERRAWDEAIALENGLHVEFDEIGHALIILKDFYSGRPFTWDLERKLHATGRLPYELIPTYLQDTGNCVAAGLAGAGQKLQVIEVALGGEEEQFREWYIPWIYAVSRNQIGGGMNGAGSTGAWGARAVNEYGVLFSDDAGVPQTNGYSDKWGRRRNAGSIESAEYGKFAPAAADNVVEQIRATSVEQMVGLLESGMVLTIASYQGFRVSEYKGLHVYRPSGSWSHQMHITDMRRDPELMFYRMNQWGPDHARPLNGETPGGAWNFASDVERELRSRNVEVYGFSLFRGHPLDTSDHNII